MGTYGHGWARMWIGSRQEVDRKWLILLAIPAILPLIIANCVLRRRYPTTGGGSDEGGHLRHDTRSFRFVSRVISCPAFQGSVSCLRFLKHAPFRAVPSGN